MARNSEQSLLEGGYTRLLIGAAIAMFSAQVMIQHGGLESPNGIMTLLSGIVLWAFGMTLTIQPTVSELKNLGREIP